MCRTLTSGSACVGSGSRVSSGVPGATLPLAEVGLATAAEVSFEAAEPPSDDAESALPSDCGPPARAGSILRALEQPTKSKVKAGTHSALMKQEEVQHASSRPAMARTPAARLSKRPISWQIRRVLRSSLLFLALTLACEREEPPRTDAGSGSLAGPRKLDTWTENPHRAGSDSPAAPSHSAEPVPADSAPQTPRAAAEGETTWRVGTLTDVGPAGPMSAAPIGVVVVSKRGALYLAKRHDDGGFDELEAPAEDFVRYGRGPAITGDFAYWVMADGRLARGSLTSGEVVVLAEGAHPGARPSSLTIAGRDLVAFLRQESSERALGFLWAGPPRGKALEHSEILLLTPEGASTTSLALVQTSDGPVAVSLEGRSSMSPLHQRPFRVTERRVTLLEDQVTWVGPGSHPLTEVITASTSNSQPVALIATARDVTHFGLAQVPLARGGKVPDASWRLYPNGLDPAPVEAATLCGKKYALFVVPSHEKPRAPQELRIAELGAEGPFGEEVLAHARAFNDVSVSARSGGAVVAWTADRRTWALDLGCPTKRAP